MAPQRKKKKSIILPFSERKKETEAILLDLCTRVQWGGLSASIWVLDMLSSTLKEKRGEQREWAQARCVKAISRLLEINKKKCIMPEGMNAPLSLMEALKVDCKIDGLKVLKTIAENALCKKHNDKDETSKANILASLRQKCVMNTLVHSPTGLGRIIDCCMDMDMKHEVALWGDLLRYLGWDDISPIAVYKQFTAPLDDYLRKEQDFHMGHLQTTTYFYCLVFVSEHRAWRNTYSQGLAPLLEVQDLRNIVIEYLLADLC